MLRAARSRWTHLFFPRYSMASATCAHMPTSSRGDIKRDDSRRPRKNARRSPPSMSSVMMKSGGSDVHTPMRRSTCGWSNIAMSRASSKIDRSSSSVACSLTVLTATATGPAASAFSDTARGSGATVGSAGDFTAGGGSNGASRASSLSGALSATGELRPDECPASMLIVPMPPLTVLNAPAPPPRDRARAATESDATAESFDDHVDAADPFPPKSFGAASFTANSFSSFFSPAPATLGGTPNITGVDALACRATTVDPDADPNMRLRRLRRPSTEDARASFCLAISRSVRSHALMSRRAAKMTPNSPRPSTFCRVTASRGISRVWMASMHSPIVTASSRRPSGGASLRAPTIAP
eukprot:Opistho-1_new@17500